MQTHISHPQAAELWQKYLQNSCTQEEMDVLFAYIQNHPAFPEEETVAEEALWQTWQQPDVPDRPQPQWDHVYATISSATQPAPVKRVLWRYSAAAAAVTLMAFTGWWAWQQSTKRVQAPLGHAPAVISKPLPQDTTYLPDGTRVIIKNSATTLSTRYTTNARIVTLNGEAWFDVKPMADAPFIVKTGAVTIQALGTAFLVSALPDKEVTVKVTNGKVQVMNNRTVVGILNAAEALVVNSHHAPVTIERNIDTAAVIAPPQEIEWRWNNSTLEEVIAWLNQHYQVTITLQGTQLQHTLFTASFTNPVTLDDILLVLQKLYNVKVTPTGANTYTLTY
ncbi:FecR family protein [Filimonas lacunae]|uniref:FecR family protein n=1 Tax=Filimonas lacunae TaxID=477680 RepID=A0A173MFJ9_9BACT|nr:FecR domain-containing protein [Filimonas lacunae]BAV06276.1 anti-sigma factor [Filimonas lacunae]SIT25605.1 FecR family protein [Filimonas lacunae]